MTRQEGLKANAAFFTQLINMLNENGCWIFPAISQAYFKKQGKLIASTKFGYEYLCEITPKDIHHLFDVDLSLGCPQLN
jgi:hypothetical protein